MSFKRRIIARLNRLPIIDSLVYTAVRGPARGLKRRGGLGWLPAFLPRMNEENAEERFLDELTLKGLIVYDVGGDQGLFTLYFARRVGREGTVVSFEPNPQSLARIEQNIRLNDFSNVRVLPFGLGERPETLTFSFPEAEPARGTAVPSIAWQIKGEQKTAVIEIRVNALDHEIEHGNLPIPNFIKLDVEGMEYPALRGMRNTLLKHRPCLFIEMHGADADEKLANAERVVALLEEIGYCLRHIESGERISGANTAVAAEGHIYCEPA